MRSQRSQPAWAESQVDVRRYLGALRRSRRLMIAIIAAITGGVLFLSLVLPNSYEATSQIVFDATADPLTPPDAESVKRQLATFDAIINSSKVQDAAAVRAPGTTAGDIEAAISSEVDPEANLVSITAKDPSPEKAAAMANAVAAAFLSVERQLEQARLAGQQERLQNELRQLQAKGTPQELAVLRDRLSAIGAQLATAGSELQLSQQADVPSSPASPKPFRNTVLAFFASLFIAVLVALARDQLRPRVSDPRELSRLTGLSVLAAVPELSHRRFSRGKLLNTAIEHEAYQTLRAALQREAPPTETRVILITSAVHAEGKTTVTARLGRALAAVGHRTLLISADLRWPGLHRIFDVPLEPGLTGMLSLVERAGVSDMLLPATAHTVIGSANGGPPALEVIASGGKPRDPAQALSGEPIRNLLQHVRSQNYDYVLIDAPPMLGIADVQGLIPQTDHTIIVARLDRLSLENISDTQDLLERLQVKPIGMLVIGGRSDVSPYYLSSRPSMFKDENQTAGTASERSQA